jgi:hypothetical protein
MNTVAVAAAEGSNELMMHSQLGAPSVYSRTRRWIAGEKKGRKVVQHLVGMRAFPV